MDEYYIHISEDTIFSIDSTPLLGQLRWLKKKNQEAYIYIHIGFHHALY